jgi:hypothetical protein
MIIKWFLTTFAAINESLTHAPRDQRMEAQLFFWPTKKGGY